MRLKLKIVSGPLMGREFYLTPGALIGRSSADFVVPDPKISGRHAKVERVSGGELKLVDVGSNNGIRVGDKRALEVVLMPGAKFRLGSTDFEVFAESDDPSSSAVSAADDELPPLPPDASSGEEATNMPAGTEVISSEPPSSVSRPTHWTQFFTNLFNSMNKSANNKNRDIKPFRPMVVLTITHGLQVGTEWQLGYGPRSVGLNSLEFPLFDSGAPLTAFSIEPDGLAAVFVTKYPDKVLLNGRARSSEKLLPGDEITVAQTRIKVSFK